MEDEVTALRAEVQHRRAAVAQWQAVHQRYCQQTTGALLRGEAALALLRRCRDQVDPALQVEIDALLRS